MPYELYEAIDIPDPKAVADDLLKHGPAKAAALSYISMHENINDGILHLEVIILAHRFNQARSDHHAFTDLFTEDDIKFVWDYLEQHQLIRPIAEIRLESD